MSNRQICIILINIFCTTYLGALQFIEKDTFGESKYLREFATFNFETRYFIAIVLGLIVAGLSSFIILMEPVKIRDEFRDSLMDGIFEQILDNDLTNSRITLFSDASFLRCWWYRIWDFFGLWKKGIPFRKNCEYCWQAKYIKIFRRWGTEHKKSKTYFYYSPETSKKCQGIAGQVRQREEVIVVELPDISKIEPDLLQESDPIVQEYMKKGYISDFRVLKGLKKPAPYVYGNIISTLSGKRKLVLVIDSWANSTPFQKRGVLDLLSTYTKQISASFGK